MKHKYKVTFNPRKARYRTYEYSYGHTSGISVSLAKNTAIVEVSLTKEYSPGELFRHGAYLFPDALQKILTLQLMLYSAPLTINKVVIEIDDKVTVIDKDELDKNPICYSLIHGELIRAFPSDKVSDAVVQRVLETKKSDKDAFNKSVESALSAFIFSKSKCMESERFIYLWMTMNGLYGAFEKAMEYYHPRFKKNGERITQPNQENKQIAQLTALYGEGSAVISRDDRNRSAQEIRSSARLWNGNVIDGKNISTEHEAIYKYIKGVLRKNGITEITAYGYLLVHVPYYYRCSVIHANKPLMLFAQSGDPELRTLQMINSTMEAFLDENICNWLDKQYIEGEVKEKATTIQIKRREELNDEHTRKYYI